ncbi:hypothetical protein ONE63_005611 [Megalurothrips usitatus]|uniref:GPI-anchor transamidase n=1 Tax=Megalurothrips usitatus TaxID=439358 RepID=A0AAV7XW36_9NEOP|nr:hypothetical protein ONE63_005611 [Megalurothrips usitatus]
MDRLSVGVLTKRYRIIKSAPKQHLHHFIIHTIADISPFLISPFIAPCQSKSSKALSLLITLVLVLFTFLRLLIGRLPPGTPRSKQLLSDEGSNVLVYLTGHGGDGFLKFQDSEEISSQELADAVEQMWQKRRYNEMFFVIDTCQASSMYDKMYSPNVLAVASSLVGEDSLSHHVDPAIGVYIIDRYTYYALDFLERVEPDSTKTLGEFLKVCPKRLCISTVGVRRDLFRRNPDKVLITDFFGAVRPVEVVAAMDSNWPENATVLSNNRFVRNL